MYNFTYIISLLLLFFSCSTEENINGCTDPEACNYNANAIADNSLCEYSEENFDCNEDCIVDTDCLGECGGSATEDCTGNCGGDAIINLSLNWNVQITASVNPWNILDAINDTAIIGISSSSTDGYDVDQDIPEPPEGPDPNRIMAYFNHSEWDSPYGENFTQDYQSNQICQDKQWILYIKANCNGAGELTFTYNDLPDNLSIELIQDNGSISLLEDTVVDISLVANTIKEFIIKVSIN